MREVKKGIYHLLHPRMAVFITSGREARPGTRNVMACAWVGPVSEEPPIVAVAVWEKSFTPKLISKYREFGICIPTKGQVGQLLKAGSVHGGKTDKFGKLGIKTLNAKLIKTPLVDGCAGYLECKLWKTVKAGECFVFFGRVVSAYAQEGIFKKGKWRNAKIPFHAVGSEMVYV